MSITVAVALLPGLFFLWLYRRWDAKRPEPAGSVLIVVLLGVFTCVPAFFIEKGLAYALGNAANAQGQFLNAFLVAAFTEEALKLSVILLYLWRKPHFDEVMDGILYTAAASLGFAMLENVLYAGGNLFLGLLRAFTAVPLHAICSGLMGYFAGRAKMAKTGGFSLVVTGLAVAVLIHGVYDWAVFSGGTFGFAPPQPLLALAEIVPLLGVCAIFLRFAVKHALKLDDTLLGPNARPLAPSAPQPYAGMPVVVMWSDGNRYPATLLQGQGGHYLCALPNGQQHWIPMHHVSPAPAAVPA